MNYLKSFIEKDISLIEDDQESNFVSNEIIESFQKNSLSLLYSIYINNEKTNRQFYLVKRFLDLSDYIAENKDKKLFLLFEIMFELENYSRKRITINFMNKKDFKLRERFY